MTGRKRVLILGAAGRDFHDFNVVFRGRPEYEVVAITAQQIPHIDERVYPPELAGRDLYPAGIPIRSEDQLEELIDTLRVDECVMSYSDVSHEQVMHLASRVSAAGADFRLLSARRTMIRSKKPVVAVCAVRTGAGKSQTARAIVALLRSTGLRVGVVRHPMPYGDLLAQRVQRFATMQDLAAHDVTIEEREEYEPHIASGSVVWAGVDYEQILRAAEQEADVILWDGGNNDTPFYEPTVHITVVDPHRPGHELRYHPGETNVRMAHVIIVNKVDTADEQATATVIANVRQLNPTAEIVEAASPILVDDETLLEGQRVLAVEDGPTVTHGEMPYGAASIAARKLGATLVDPRAFAVGEIADTFQKYPNLGPLLPAMGYGERQVHDLQRTLDRAALFGVEAVAIGTPIDLARLVRIALPHTRVRYELHLLGGAAFERLLEPVLEAAGALTAN
ncbi:MAG TPA: cyclic 2,3-diphosphoglycerate synthase [Longimicrobiales bacterium]|nr:cyclic 2,3-diphosphoglycerate synthase [Longimicrobiales bacterium]